MASYRAPKAREIDQSHNPMYAMAKEYVNTIIYKRYVQRNSCMC